MNYFAYGSNLGLRRLQERCPGVAPGMIAKLSEWRVVFNKISKDGSAKANIERFEASCVWGVIYEIRPEELTGLRAAEGHPKHYIERDLSVDCNGTRITVTTYIAAPEKIASDPPPPYSWYLNHIVRGAIKCGLSDAYVESLKKTPADEDPDSDRDAKERSIWKSGKNPGTNS